MNYWYESTAVGAKRLCPAYAPLTTIASYTVGHLCQQSKDEQQRDIIERPKKD